jgi:hypothetical protein
MKEDNNDYQEKLSNQIEQINKCIYKNNLSDKKKIQCIIDYINNDFLKKTKTQNTFLTKKRYQKNTLSKTAFNKSSGKKLTLSKNTFSKKVISKTPKIKTQKKMNNNVPRIEQHTEIKPDDIPITIDTIGLYINSIKNK